MRLKHKKKGQGSSESQKQQDNKSGRSQISNQQVINIDYSFKVIPVAKVQEKLKTKKIVINISDTQYPIIQEIAEELGWVIEKEEGIGDWDVWWTDRQINADTLFRMNVHQKINHFPGIYVISRKNLLGLNLMAMRDRFLEEYNFFPQTWLIPLQFSKFRLFYQSLNKNEACTYIVKPEASSQGKGIFLTRNISNVMTGRKYVVQRYITNPFLIDELKFDFRIYVLLAGTDPLRLYIYQQGLTRFATTKYEQPTDQNLRTAFIHLTNYSLNKKNPQYIYNRSQQDMNIGHKRTLTSTYEYLSKKGYDIKILMEQIQDVIIKTIIAGLPAISHQYHYCQPEQYQNNMCFHILGIDIMINSDLKPYLIEVNHTPSFETGTPLDYKVKKNLITDALKIMRISSKNKKMLFEKAKVMMKNKVQNGKKETLKKQKRQELLKQAQQKRDKQEKGLMGGFKKIFPIDNIEKMQQYKKMIEHAEQVHKETAETRQKIIREQQQKEKINKRQKNQLQPEGAQSKFVRINSFKNENKPKQLKQIREFTQKVKRKISDNFLEQQKLQTKHEITVHSENTLTENVVDKYSSLKNCSFRTKTRKILDYATNLKEAIGKYSKLMLNNMMNVNKLFQDSYEDSKLQKPIKTAKKKRQLEQKKNKDNLKNTKSVKETLKKGTYIRPKMYSIIHNKDTLLLEARFIKRNMVEKECTSPNCFESQKFQPISTQKVMYKKHKFSLD